MFPNFMHHGNTFIDLMWQKRNLLLNVNNICSLDFPQEPKTSPMSESDEKRKKERKKASKRKPEP